MGGGDFTVISTSQKEVGVYTVNAGLAWLFDNVKFEELDPAFQRDLLVQADRLTQYVYGDLVYE